MGLFPISRWLYTLQYLYFSLTLRLLLPQVPALDQPQHDAHSAGQNSVVSFCNSDMQSTPLLASHKKSTSSDKDAKGSVLIQKISPSNKPQLDLKVSVTISDTQERISVKALLDSSCTKSCVDEKFVEARQLQTFPTEQAIPVYNADKKLNGYIREYVELVLAVTDVNGNEHTEVRTLPVVNLRGTHNIFLGFDWLQEHNPEVDWPTKQLLSMP
jgi:hypothetical protein